MSLIPLAHFSGGTVNFGDATFSGGTASFSGATFSGGTVDFSHAASWTQAPRFGPVSMCPIPLPASCRRQWRALRRTVRCGNPNW